MSKRSFIQTEKGGELVVVVVCQSSWAHVDGQNSQTEKHIRFFTFHTEWVVKTEAQTLRQNPAEAANQRLNVRQQGVWWGDRFILFTEISLRLPAPVFNFNAMAVKEQWGPLIKDLYQCRTTFNEGGTGSTLQLWCLITINAHCTA